MKQFFRATFNVMRREFHRIAERKTLYLLSIALPIGLFIFLSAIYINGVTRDIPIAILDQDRSELSRTIIRYIDATSSMRVVATVNNFDDADRALKSSSVYAVFTFPKNMEANIKKGKNETVTVLKNNFNLVIGNSILKDASTILRTVSVGITMKRLGMKGLSEQQAFGAANAISVQTQTLFNPYYNYADYLLPGLLPVMLQLIIVVAGVLVISSEFSHQTFHDLVRTANNSTLSIVIGKSLPHIGLHCATALGIIGIIFPLFSIEIHGSIIGGLVMYAVFITASFSFAFMLSSLFHDQFFATEAALLISTPAFIFSGYTFPIDAMPAADQFVSALMPFTHFIRGFMKSSIMNAPFHFYRNDILTLCSFTFVTLTISSIAIHRSIRKHIL